MDLFFCLLVLLLCSCGPVKHLFGLKNGPFKTAHTYCQRFALISTLYSVKLLSSSTVRICSTAVIRCSQVCFNVQSHFALDTVKVCPQSSFKLCLQNIQSFSSNTVNVWLQIQSTVVFKYSQYMSSNALKINGQSSVKG